VDFRKSRRLVIAHLFVTASQEEYKSVSTGGKS